MDTGSLEKVFDKEGKHTGWRVPSGTGERVFNEDWGDPPMGEPFQGSPRELDASQSTWPSRFKSPLFVAATKKYEAQIAEADATLEIYFKNSVGIGEHSDLLAEVDKYIELKASALDKLETLKTLKDKAHVEFF
jgi:hypothetical protein